MSSRMAAPSGNGVCYTTYNPSEYLYYPPCARRVTITSSELIVRRRLPALSLAIQTSVSCISGEPANVVLTIESLLVFLFLLFRSPHSAWAIECQCFLRRGENGGKQ